MSCPAQPRVQIQCSVLTASTSPLIQQILGYKFISATICFFGCGVKSLAHWVNYTTNNLHNVWQEMGI